MAHGQVIEVIKVEQERRERDDGIDPVMNEQGEAADEMKCVRPVCVSFLFSLIHSAL